MRINDNTKNPRIRYEVKATSVSAEVIKKYNDWIIKDHSKSLLECDGCTEFRLLSIDKFCSISEYLFVSKQAFADYEANDAPRLRAISQKFFDGDEISFYRSHSRLIAESENR